MSSLVHVVVEHLGLAQDGRLAEDAGVEVPDGDLVAVGGAPAVTGRDAVRLDLRPVERELIAGQFGSVMGNKFR